jgi:L-asparaginase
LDEADDEAAANGAERRGAEGSCGGEDVTMAPAGKPQVLALGGTIAMVPSASSGGEIAPKLGAEELVASAPALAEVAQIEARSPFRLPSLSLQPANLIEVAQTIEDAFGDGCVGAVVVRETEMIEESALIFDLLVASDRPVVVTGAMRGADAPGADGPATLLAAVRVAVCPEARGLGTLAVFNYDIQAARLRAEVPHGAAFCLRVAPGGADRRGRERAAAVLDAGAAPPLPADLRRSAASRGADPLDNGRGRPLARAAARRRLRRHRRRGHGRRARTRARGAAARGARGAHAGGARVAPHTGPVFTRTYGYAGSEMDLLARGLVPAGFLSGLKARLLLGLALRPGAGPGAAGAALAPYH